MTADTFSVIVNYEDEINTIESIYTIDKKYLEAVKRKLVQYELKSEGIDAWWRHARKILLELSCHLTVMDHTTNPVREHIQKPKNAGVTAMPISYRDLVAGIVIGMLFSTITFMVGFYAKWKATVQSVIVQI